MLKLLYACFLFLPVFNAMGQAEGTGLEISVSGDMVYAQGLSRDSRADDKLTMRGAELMFYAPVDFRFDGVLSAAAHEERGKTVFELHELYLASSKLLPRSVIKAGQFFLSIGRLNRFHRHDWPFQDAPKVQRIFFAKEGVFDAGLEYSLLFPFRYVSNLTVGLGSGYRYGHSHTEGGKPNAPTHYLRYSIFFPFGNVGGGMDVGFNYLGRTDTYKNEMELVGLDLTGKWRGMRRNKWLFQSEIWYKREKDIQNETTREIGLYAFNEFPLGETVGLGFRLDAFKELSKTDALTGLKINNISYGGTLQGSFSSSEFAKIRTTLSHEFERLEGRTTAKDTRLGLQLVFILGSHPAHDF